MANINVQVLSLNGLVIASDAISGGTANVISYPVVLGASYVVNISIQIATFSVDFKGNTAANCDALGANSNANANTINTNSNTINTNSNTNPNTNPKKMSAKCGVLLANKHAILLSARATWLGSVSELVGEN